MRIEAYPTVQKQMDPQLLPATSRFKRVENVLEIITGYNSTSSQSTQMGKKVWPNAISECPVCKTPHLEAVRGGNHKHNTL